jgi:hypothetical protein
MITLNITLPSPVAAEFYQAAEELNRRFGETTPKIEAKTLMAFALAGHDWQGLCEQFDLSLRIIRGEPASPPLPNPVIK